MKTLATYVDQHHDTYSVRKHSDDEFDFVVVASTELQMTSDSYPTAQAAMRAMFNQILIDCADAVSLA